MFSRKGFTGVSKKRIIENSHEGGVGNDPELLIVK
jgi:hypothetical protein